MATDDEKLKRVEAATEFPLLLLAIVLLPLIALPWFVELSPGVSQAFLAVDWLIWGVFACVFAVKLAVAPRKLSFLRANWLELATVVLPFLRPLRLFRVLRLLRVATILGVNTRLIRQLAEQRGARFSAAAALCLLVACASAAWLAERNQDGANITTWGDSLWWAVTTMTTVGYGDAFPITPLGRGIAVLLMLVGIAMVSVLTATIAAFIVRDDEGTTLVDVMKKLEAIEQRLNELSKPAEPEEE